MFLEAGAVADSALIGRPHDQFAAGSEAVCDAFGPS